MTSKTKSRRTQTKKNINKKQKVEGHRRKTSTFQIKPRIRGNDNITNTLPIQNKQNRKTDPKASALNKNKTKQKNGTRTQNKYTTRKRTQNKHTAN